MLRQVPNHVPGLNFRNIACMVLKTGRFGKQVTNNVQDLTVVLKKDEDQLDRSCEKLSITYSEGGKEYPTYTKKKEGRLDCSK